ncbi:citrate synthase [Saccharolobus islandicus]|uniref:Citrate synthase n=3 Tax=Saccharolobus islandicus TaxID=43080 RepID=M9UIG5_SACIS|nr:citrate synthase [Sulfolobus islandicus]ADX84018.1 2-methylcitrate synthase/citrate synthase II [Sulfolobus islandicus HVE10/4]ADX86663.1 2-methylcitrate synthase/citrate synthase II [Sulfolobus islandicus REY15A]AGJ64000.1 Citrate synthase [Sulfolobus islandicus LAL14/1]WCM37303.1 citrate synthase [Sulfolobus islandicus]
MSVVSKGLENVIIKVTNLTFIDGEKGILRYRGYNIEDLVNYGTYEETIYLMLYGKLPTKKELNDLREKLNEEYEVPQEVLDSIYLMPRDADAIGLLEVGTAALASIDKNFKWKENDKEKAISIIAKMATLVSNVYRRKEGNKPRIPEPSDSFAKSFLLASLAREPTAEEINAMDKALILYTDHEVPASTTAALVAASTLSDMYSSLTAALAALKGPLHGGAAEEAFKQFVEIGDPNRVEMWFNDKIINQKNRLMGFGHRVYKTYDPRAKIFKELASTLIERNSEAKKYFEIAQKLEELGIKQFSSKEIYPNTDFYSGIVFFALGFPVYMFTALFALSRTLGWLAHIIEYVEEQHRLIRPRALYVGPEHQEYVPIDKR